MTKVLPHGFRIDAGGGIKRVVMTDDNGVDLSLQHCRKMW